MSTSKILSAVAVLGCVFTLTMAEVAQALDSLGSTRELLDRFKAVVKRVFRPTCCVISFEGEKIDSFEAAAEEMGTGLSLIAAVMDRVETNKEALIFDRFGAPGELDTKGVEEINSVIATPIMVGDHVCGSLYVDHRGQDQVQFNRDDLKSLVVVSRLISAAA